MRNNKLWLTTVISISLFILIGASMRFTQLGYTPAAQAQTNTEAGATLPRTITVVGEGTVNIEPDIAQATIGVQVTGPDVRETSSEAEEIMTAVLAAIRDQGVAEEDIQTAGFNIFVDRSFGPTDQPTDDEVIYRVNNDVRVIIRDLDMVSSVLDAAIEAGANNIYGVNFSVDDPSQAASEAREQAVTNAQTKVEELAQLAGVELGEVVSISEIIGGRGAPIGLPYQESAVAGRGGGGPIEPGELTITTQLEVVYAIQ